MRKHATVEAPLEACGLVAGAKGVSQQVFRIKNELASASHFRMDAEQQVAAFLYIEANGWDLLAIYHSHPAGPPHPSRTDLAEALYPGVIHLIWSKEGNWVCRAFSLDDGIVQTLHYELISE